MTRVYFDTEFTGLQKGTELISIGLVDEDGNTFYAELNDYDKDMITPWLQENVVDNLLYNNTDVLVKVDKGWPQKLSHFRMKDDREAVGKSLCEWFKRFDKVEIWSDCLAYDWVLFNDLFGTAFDIPSNVYYIPFDICTAFKMRGIDPDISREAFADNKDLDGKHNALHDALVIKACYDKLVAK